MLLDREIHWMYNKSRLQPWRKTKGSYLELVVSASQKFAALSREEAIELAVRELAEFFPAVAEAKLEKAALVKEVRATFTVPPGIDAARPGSVSPWPNCVLAGDWIATGWPSTMESAARSGHLAAEAVCAAIGEPRSNSQRGLEAAWPDAILSVILGKWAIMAQLAGYYSMREQIHADADQHGGGPAAAVDIFLEEDFAGDGVGDQRERGGGWGDEAQVQMIQREEQREKGQQQERTLRRRRAGR